MEPNKKIEITEDEPLLAKPTSVRPKTPTTTFLLPLGMFMYACGLQLGSTTTKQFVYNYTSIEEGHKNTSLSLQAANDSQKSCDRNLSTSQHTDDKVAADWLLYFELIEYTIGIPVIVLAGIYSDFYGRRIFLLLPTFGGCVQYLVLFGIVYFGLTIEYVCVIYGVSGIVGTHYTFYLIATSSVADTTGTGKSRSFHIMLIYLYMGIGLTSASLGTGFIIQNVGFAIPCAISSGLCFIGFLVLCNTHETLTSKLRSDKPPFCKTFLRFFGLFFGKGLRKKSDAWKFNLTLAAFFIMLSPMTATSSLTTLYFLGEPFCFSSEILGYFNGSTDFLHLVIATPILKLFHWCLQDEAIIIIGLIVSGVPYMVVLAFAASIWMVFLGAGLGVIFIIPLSLFRGMMSRMASEKYQGALFAVIYFFEAVCRMAANSLFLPIYGHTQSLMQGFVFLVMAGFYVISALIFLPVAVTNIAERKRNSTQTIVINVNNS